MTASPTTLASSLRSSARRDRGEALRALHRPLTELRRRARIHLFMEGLLEFVLAIIGLAMLQLLLDRALKFSADQRIALNLVITGLWITVAYRSLVRRLTRTLYDWQLVNLLNRSYPELRGVLTAGLQFAAHQGPSQSRQSRALESSAIEAACEAIRNIDPKAVFDQRRLRQHRVSLGLMLVLALAAWLIQPSLMWTWFARNWLVQDISWPQRTYIDPIGFEDRLRYHPRGEPLRIEARLRGDVPTEPVLTWQPVDPALGDQRTRRVSMTRVGSSRLFADLGIVRSDLQLRLRGNDAQTRPLTVRVVDRPALTSIAVRIESPSYTGLEPRVIEGETSLEVLTGTKLTVDISANKALSEAIFTDGRDFRQRAAAIDASRYRLRLHEVTSGSYWFTLRDTTGLENIRPIRFQLRVLDDQTPIVQLEAPRVGEFCTPQARLDLELRAEDDYGLRALDLTYLVDDQPPTVLTPDAAEVREAVTPRQLQREQVVDLSTLDLAPGSSLRLVARATDIDPAEANVGLSASIALRVLSRDEFLNEIARRETRLRREFEQLVSAQRGIEDGLARFDATPPDSSSDLALGWRQQLRTLGRRQDWHASRVTALAGEFRQLLAELEVNQLARRADRRRLVDRIVDPLESLGDRDMPDAAAAIVDWSNVPGDEPRASALVAQRVIIERCERILNEMRESEGFRQTIETLERLIAQQEDLRGRTQAALAEELEAILSLDDLEDLDNVSDSGDAGTEDDANTPEANDDGEGT